MFREIELFWEKFFLPIERNLSLLDPKTPKLWFYIKLNKSRNILGL